MGTKTVIGVDSREWSVSRKITWTLPATGEDFEHDVDGGRGAAFLILSALFVFWVIVVVWAPVKVHVPWYLWVLGVLIGLFFPVRWWLRRPWTIVAETVGDYGDPKSAQRWIGLVRGGVRAREEVRIIVRRLRTEGSPAHVDSPLQLVN